MAIRAADTVLSLEAQSGQGDVQRQLFHKSSVNLYFSLFLQDRVLFCAGKSLMHSATDPFPFWLLNENRAHGLRLSSPKERQQWCTL